MFQPLQAWPGAKGYCIPWGSTDLEVAEQMLCADALHIAAARRALRVASRRKNIPRGSREKKR